MTKLHFVMLKKVKINFKYVNNNNPTKCIY